MMTHFDKIKTYSKLYELYDKDLQKVLNAVTISKTTIEDYLKDSIVDDVVYDKNFEKVLNAVTISESTLNKYITLCTLEDNILQLLDSAGENKLTLDYAVELTTLPKHIDRYQVIRYLQGLTSLQQTYAIKEFILQKKDNIDSLIDIKADILIKGNNIILDQSVSSVPSILEFPSVPDVPYVKDENGQKIQISESMYEDIIKLIRDKTGTITYV